MAFKTRFGLLLLVFAAHFQLWADADLFHHRAVMPDGPTKGKALEVSIKRAVVILEDTPYARVYGLKPDSTLVANIYHNKKFYVARVPKKAVVQTQFISEPFGGAFAHSMLRFEFAEDNQVELISEIPTEEEAEARLPGKAITPILLQDLLMTVEANGLKGEPPFSFVKGMMNLHGLVYRITSLTGRGTSNYTSKKAKAYQTVLNLTREESNRALEISLRTSHNVGMNHMYNTAYKNCNIFSYRILNSARPLLCEEHTFAQNLKGMLLKIVDEAGVLTRVWPSFGKAGLYWRGFVSTKHKVTLMNDDPRFLKLAHEYECEKALSANAN